MSITPPALTDLIVANDALGDAGALDRIWEEHGYLFFRDVLDKDVVACVRRKVLAVLADLGVVETHADDASWNGTDLSNFPGKVEALYQAGIWRHLVANPGVQAFFESVIGEPISWIPLCGYRTTAPASGDSDNPFENRHQDGFMNGDMPFRTCWIPLDLIDRDTGGLVLADGEHKRGYLHDRGKPPRYPIPDGAVPPAAWRHSVYRPGDVIMFHNRLPHAGLPNRSGKFRLSMDVRLIPARDPARPWVGRILSIAPEGAAIDCDGERRIIRFDDDTYFRANSGTRLSFVEILPFLPEGTEVMIGQKTGIATMMKPIQ